MAASLNNQYHVFPDEEYQDNLQGNNEDQILSQQHSVLDVEAGKKVLRSHTTQTRLQEVVTTQAQSPKSEESNDQTNSENRQNTFCQQSQNYMQEQEESFVQNFPFLKTDFLEYYDYPTIEGYDKQDGVGMFVEKYNYSQYTLDSNQQFLFFNSDDLIQYQPIGDCTHSFYSQPNNQSFGNLCQQGENQQNEDYSEQAQQKDNIFSVEQQQQLSVSLLKNQQEAEVNQLQVIDEEQNQQQQEQKQDENLLIQVVKNEMKSQLEENCEARFHNNVIKNVMSSFKRFIVHLFRYHMENVNNRKTQNNKEKIGVYYCKDRQDCEFPLEETRQTIMELYNKSTRGRKSEDRKVFVKKYLKAFKEKRYNLQSFQQLINSSSYSSIFLYYLKNFVINWLTHSRITNEGTYHKFIQEQIDKARNLNRDY